MSYNKVVLVGNLTRDCEIKYSQAGTAICSVGLATNRKWKDQSGQQKEEVMFIDLVFYGRTAEIANTYLKKSSKILIDGRLTYQTWTDQQGQKRSKHVITVENLQMLDSKQDSQNQPQQNNYGGQQQQNYQQSQQANQGGYSQHQQTYGQPQGKQPSVPEINIDEDEIPF